MHKQWFGALALGLIVASAAQAADNGWSGELEAGGTNTTGNSETTSFHVNGELQRSLGSWTHQVDLEVLNTTDEEGTSAERYLLSGQSDYQLDSRNYLFGRLAWVKNRFIGYDYQLSETLGYGRKLLTDAPLTLDVEAGVGARQTRFVDGDRENEAILRFAADLDWDLSENADFSEEFSVEAGGDRTITRSVTALTANLTETLAMRVSFIVQHTSEVPSDRKKTDTETALSLVYGF